MTLAMPDSTVPANLPPGYRAYLGYVDGKWPTWLKLAALFPSAKVVSLTVLAGQAIGADGVDIEPGNSNATSGTAWIARKLARQPGSRPVAYASMEGQPGYGMPDVIAELAELGIDRAQVRLLTAHYTGVPHVCSPATCRTSDGQPISFTADGTQWTSAYPGVGGASIDMSLLADDFFGVTPPATPNWTEKMMQELPVVKQGQTGNAVRTVQGLCGARGHVTAVDGVFGPLTVAAVKAVQAAAKIAVDGICGPQTWPVLLGL